MKKVILTLVIAFCFVTQGRGQDKVTNDSIKVDIEKMIDNIKLLQATFMEWSELKELRTQAKLKKVKKANESIKIITLDFKDKVFTERFKNIKTGEFYRLKVENINMNRYNIVINKTDSIIVSNVEFPTFDAIGLGAITDIISKLKTNTVSVARQVAFYQDGDNRIQGEIANLNTLQIQIGQALIESTDNKNKKNLNEKNKLIYINDSLGQRIVELNIQSKLLNSKKVIIKKVESVMDSVKKELEDSKLYINKINDSIIPQFELNVLHFHESNDTIPKESFFGSYKAKPLQEILNSCLAVRDSLQQAKDKIVKEEQNYFTFKGSDTAFASLYENDSTIKKEHTELLSNVSQSKSALDTALSKISPAVVSKYLTTIIDLHNNKDRSYTSLPFQHNEDISKLNITITPKKPEYGPSYSTELRFPKKKSYVGVGASFYYARFENEVFSTQATIIDSTRTDYSIIDEKNKKGEIGLTTLIHFGYWPIHKAPWFAINFVAGPGLSLSNTVKPRIVLGGGLALGTKNMFTINGLFLGGFVDMRSAVYDNDGPYSSKPENITVSKLVGRGGISLGYIHKF